MRAAASLHAQLAAIMEAQANAALAQICALVDGGFELLRQEVTRSRKENELLRRKLRLAETRTARVTALRAAASAGGTALPLPSGRARPQTLAHHPGNDPRENRTSGGAVASRRGGGASQDPPTDSAQPALTSVSLTAAPVKEEDDSDGESWSRSESGVAFCQVLQELKQETEAPPPLTRQEEADEAPPPLTRQEEADEAPPPLTRQEEADEAPPPLTRQEEAWTNDRAASVQLTLSPGQRSESSGYEGATYEPQFQHGRPATQNPRSENPGRGGASEDPGGGRQSAPCAAEHLQPAVFTPNRQGAAPATEGPRRQVRRQPSSEGRDGWRRRGGVGGAAGPSAGKRFACQRCGKTLACLRNLRSHMRVHTGNKPFVCPLCAKPFSDASNLKRHQSVHTGEKRYGCVHCGKRFAQSGTLKVHMSVHARSKHLRCLRCGETFTSGGHLRRHVSAHAGETTPTPSSLGR